MIGIRYRFYLKVVPGKFNCMIWSGGRTEKGYGQFWFDGKNVKAHRFVWFMFFGSWPTDEIDHLCRNTRCVNIEHLEDVTMLENMKRRWHGIV